jgi:hypothetical protein
MMATIQMPGSQHDPLLYIQYGGGGKVPGSFIEVLGAVGGADDKDAAVRGGGVTALHLH